MWKNDITNTPSQEIDSVTSSAGYKQIIDKLTRVVNNNVMHRPKRCKKIISNHEVGVTIFEKCHHNIIYGEINIRVPLPPI